jgi:hypothetical protein
MIADICLNFLDDGSRNEADLTPEKLRREI